MTSGQQQHPQQQVRKNIQHANRSTHSKKRNKQKPLHRYSSIQPIHVIHYTSIYISIPSRLPHSASLPIRPHHQPPRAHAASSYNTDAIFSTAAPQSIHANLPIAVGFPCKFVKISILVAPTSIVHRSSDSWYTTTATHGPSQSTPQPSCA